MLAPPSEGFVEGTKKVDWVKWYAHDIETILFDTGDLGYTMQYLQIGGQFVQASMCVLCSCHELTHLPLFCIYASVNRVSIGSDNGLLQIQHQAII